MLTRRPPDLPGAGRPGHLATHLLILPTQVPKEAVAVVNIFIYD